MLVYCVCELCYFLYLPVRMAACQWQCRCSGCLDGDPICSAEFYFIRSFGVGTPYPKLEMSIPPEIEHLDRAN